MGESTAGGFQYRLRLFGFFCVSHAALPTMEMQSEGHLRGSMSESPTLRLGSAHEVYSSPRLMVCITGAYYLFIIAIPTCA